MSSAEVFYGDQVDTTWDTEMDLTTATLKLLQASRLGDDAVIDLTSSDGNLAAGTVIHHTDADREVGQYNVTLYVEFGPSVSATFGVGTLTVLPTLTHPAP